MDQAARSQSWRKVLVLVRGEDYSVPGSSYQALGGRPELGAQQTVVRSFVAPESTFYSTNIVRKRTSGARCS